MKILHLFYLIPALLTFPHLLIASQNQNTPSCFDRLKECCARLLPQQKNTQETEISDFYHNFDDDLDDVIVHFEKHKSSISQELLTEEEKDQQRKKAEEAEKISKQIVELYNNKKSQNKY